MFFSRTTRPQRASSLASMAPNSVRRRHQAIPVVGDSIGKSLLREGGDIGQDGVARVGRRPQRLQGTGFDMGQQHRHVAEHGLHLPAEQVGNRRRGAAIWYVQELYARGGLKQLQRQMRDAAGAGRAERDRAGAVCGQGGQLLG